MLEKLRVTSFLQLDGGALKKLRIDRGFSLADVAHALGVSRQAVLLWEHERTMPKHEAVVALRQLFGEKFDEVFRMSHDVPSSAPVEPSKPVEPLNYLTADREAFIAVLTAIVASDEVPPLVAHVLENHLGLGWMRDFAHARSSEERESIVVRRLLLHRPVRNARAKASLTHERVDQATSHEDGGAR